MAKARKVFICRDCGSTHSRWMGKCPDCGQWDTLEEETLDQGPASQLGVAAVPFAQAAALVEDGVPDAVQARPATAQPMSQISGPEPVRRIASGIGELDRVLGGGVVPGSAILAGGEPGIGKSTLLLQAARAWAKAGSRVLYVSSEESAEQVGMRAARIADGPSDGKAEQELYLLAETNLARIVEQAKRTNPRIMIIDSVQMIYKADLPASPGSVTQLRRCCSELVYLAKLSGVAIVLVGHVTKEGQLAAAAAGAPGRRRAPLRGRPLPRPPHRARGQEPLRHDARDRHLRDDRRRPARGARRRRGCRGARLGVRTPGRAWSARS